MPSINEQLRELKRGTEEILVEKDFIERIKSKKFNKATISGCIIEKISNSLIIYKENRKKC